eukprot:1161771-Pelagomonas_calceolata.AAC.4
MVKGGAGGVGGHGVLEVFGGLDFGCMNKFGGDRGCKGSMGNAGVAGRGVQVERAGVACEEYAVVGQLSASFRAWMAGFDFWSVGWSINVEVAWVQVYNVSAWKDAVLGPGNSIELSPLYSVLKRDVDEADPILVEADTRRCSSSSSSDDSSRCSNPFFIIRITDTGGGIPSSKLFSLMHYFGTTHAPREAS